MFMADFLHLSVDPLIRCFLIFIFEGFENVSFENLPAYVKLIYYLIDAMI